MDSKLYSKANIIVEAHQRYRGENDWKEFFEINDLGLALAYTAHFRLGEINDQGRYWLDKTWVDLCRMVMVDSDEEYDFLEDMLEIGVIDE